MQRNPLILKAGNCSFPYMLPIITFCQPYKHRALHFSVRRQQEPTSEFLKGGSTGYQNQRTKSKNSGSHSSEILVPPWTNQGTVLLKFPFLEGSGWNMMEGLISEPCQENDIVQVLKQPEPAQLIIVSWCLCGVGSNRLMDRSDGKMNSFVHLQLKWMFAGTCNRGKPFP